MLLYISNFTIIGCKFNLIQSWFKKIQELCLIAAYEHDNLLKYSFGLMYLNPEDVSEKLVFNLMSE